MHPQRGVLPASDPLNGRSDPASVLAPQDSSRW